MRILVAPDSFKGSLTARQVAQAISNGLRRADPHVELVLAPISDGGEGLQEILTPALGGVAIEVPVTGPLGDPHLAQIGWVEQDETAIIEVAQACGMALVPPGEQDIWRASSFGVGELLVAARSLGARRIIIGLGGSATNDGGAGMATALGARISDSAGQTLRGMPADVRFATDFEWTRTPYWDDVDVVIAADVTNPLLGPNGASTVFGPQKGAQPEDIPELESVLKRWNALLLKDVSALPAAGAAGGIGGALIALLDAEVQPGIDLVMDALHFPRLLLEVDLVITGEGRIDKQTASGKAPWGLRNAAAPRAVPTVAFCGQKGPGWQTLLGAHGFAAIVEVTPAGISHAQAMRDAERFVTDAAAKIAVELPALAQKPVLPAVL